METRTRSYDLELLFNDKRIDNLIDKYFYFIYLFYNYIYTCVWIYPNGLRRNIIEFELLSNYSRTKKNWSFRRSNDDFWTEVYTQYSIHERNQDTSVYTSKYTQVWNAAKDRDTRKKLFSSWYAWKGGAAWTDSHRARELRRKEKDKDRERGGQRVH